MNSSNPKIAIADWRIELEKKLKWLLIYRLIILLLLFGAISIFLSHITILFKLFAGYSVVTLGYLGALYFWKATRKKFSFTFLYGIELFFEIAIETAIVHYSGGAASPFTFLYMLTILSSAFVYELPGTIITATGTAIAYFALVYLKFKLIVPQTTSMGDELIFANQDMAFAIAYIQVCFLYIVAFFAGFLSRKIRTHLGELAEAKRKLEQVHWNTDQILQHMRNGLITVDENGIIVYFNNSAGRILQIPPEQAAGKNFADFFPERLSTLVDFLNQALIYHTVQRREIEVENRYGQKIPLALVLSTLRVRDEIRGVIALFEDITEEKRRDELLQQMEKLAAIGELSARLAHELRNPLAAIRGGVEMLLDEAKKQNSSERLSNLILKESDRLTQILESFLSFARLKELPPEYFRSEIVDISGLINSVIESASTLWGQHEIEIISKLPPHLQVIGNKDQLIHVFQNLIKNSFEAIGDNRGAIEILPGGARVGLFDKEELVGIAISDTGPGIAEEFLRKVFEPFFTQKEKGTGLGLSIVQGIINQLGGYIEVKSEIGEGAEFIVYIPRAQKNTKNIPSI